MDEQGDSVCARKWIKEAAERGDPGAQVQQATYCIKDGNIECAKSFLHKVAKQGDPRDQYVYGFFLLNVLKDVAGAKKWLKKSMYQGNLESRDELKKLCLEEGDVKCLYMISNTPLSPVVEGVKMIHLYTQENEKDESFYQQFVDSGVPVEKLDLNDEDSSQEGMKWLQSLAGNQNATFDQSEDMTH